jgi:Arc/MetJ-type ribon-helix-helix transcriptional regulator
MAEVQKVRVTLTAGPYEALKVVVDAGEYAIISEVLGYAIQEWRRRHEPRESEASPLQRLRDEGKARAVFRSTKNTVIASEAWRSNGFVGVGAAGSPRFARDDDDLVQAARKRL